MTLQQQQERMPATVAAPKAESALGAFWREVVVENPVYQREINVLAIPAGYAPEKADALREKVRKKQQEWATLTRGQKAWRALRPHLIVFAIGYTLIPLLLTYLSGGSGAMIGPLVGPVIGGLFGASMVTAAAIAGEREKRTWNALLLSRLTPQQIIGGKVASILRALLIGMGSLVALLLSAIAHGFLSPTVLLLVVLVLLPNLLLTTLIGVRTSLWSKSAQEAQKKSLWQGLGLGVLVLLTLVPILLALFGKAPIALLLLAPAYSFIALWVSQRIWQKMLGELWRAPKDFSG